MAVANANKSHFSQGAIEELLLCAICRDRLNDPRVLSCQHYFCKKCLQGKFLPFFVHFCCHTVNVWL